MDLSGLGDFLTSATAPWWSGLLGIIVGAVGTNIANKRSDDRQFAEARRTRSDQVELEERRRVEDRALAAGDARRAEIRSHIASLIRASSAVLRVASVAITAESLDDRVKARGDAMTHLGETFYHMTELHMRCDGGIVELAISLNNQSANIALTIGAPHELPSMSESLKNIQTSIVNAAKHDPDFTGKSLDELKAIIRAQPPYKKATPDTGRG